MKKIVLILSLVLLFSPFAFAEDRYTFYERYDLSSNALVYDRTGATSTGDVVAVFTYDKKTIFISIEEIGSTNIYYQVEGRPVGELDTWSILDTGDIGRASADTSKNIAIDVTELVDYLRVGLRRQGTDGTDRINVRGIFRKSN